jgi:hypothetical protein
MVQNTILSWNVPVVRYPTYVLKCKTLEDVNTAELDLQFADWLTKEICGFTICRLIKRIFGLAYLRNLRISDCGLGPIICGFAIFGL